MPTANLPVDLAGILATPLAVTTTGIPLTWWITVTAFVLTACALTYVAVYWPRHQAAARAGLSPAPPSTFEDLTAAHDLTEEDRSLLQQAAARLELSQPLLLFVNPDLLDQACGHGLSDTRLTELKRRLFGAAPETQNTAADPAHASAGTVGETDAIAAGLLNDLPVVSAEHSTDEWNDSGSTRTESPIPVENSHVAAHARASAGNV